MIVVAVSHTSAPSTDVEQPRVITEIYNVSILNILIFNIVLLHFLPVGIPNQVLEIYCACAYGLFEY